jgi:cephalosporin hydroxylase
MSEFPRELHSWCGRGLRIWQYPTQFSKYLAQLSRLNVRSYLEIGIRHGGSFVATTEYLERFHPLDFAVGVDVIPCPSMAAYQALNAKAAFWCTSTRAADFAARLDELGPIDLVFIDSHHEEEQCRAELGLVAERAGMIALHDIANVGCPGVSRVWQELKRSPGHACFEYVDQYGGLGPFMGIGLAVRRERLP